ncbi:hypothetical protein B0T10DRAFT_491020 [Thelonectria olida]|uniref:Mid2 domain-containing protein n=1 Tax=Thelonectria olida TaxID=1576542 RepID=A0A9P8W336_9HYPO|nr:hypothetical protein B0T10DRAFT_491020 [Thelonectria olida]
MRLILQLALTLLFARNAFSQAVFRRPPGSGPSQNYLDNPTYMLGDELEIIWEMDYNITTLVMWNQDAYGNFPQPISADILVNTTRLNYTWTVSFDNFSSQHDPTLSNVYYFKLSDAERNLGDTTSHYFNISGPSKASATATPVPTVTKIVYREKEEALSQGAVAGISIAATVVAMSLLGAMAFFVWRRSQRPRPRSSSSSEAEVISRTNSVLVSELKSDALRAEMDNGSYPGQWGEGNVRRYEVPG